MQDFTTHETSLKLKEAGFPQPQPEFGQVWWLIHENGPILAVVGSANFAAAEHLDKVFAPRVTDLLMQMHDPHCYKEEPESPVLTYRHFDGKFMLWRSGKPRIPNENPSEMAALIYLQK
jgi:hypothetical protein